MLLPVLSVRRFLLLGMMVAGLVALADGVVRHELQQAIGDAAFAVAGGAVE